MASFQVTTAAIDLGKPDAPKGLNTGIGFFNHMLDQLNSHAQIGVSVLVEKPAADDDYDDDVNLSDKNRFSRYNQNDIVTAVARSLGGKLGLILSEAYQNDASSGGKRKRNEDSAPTKVTFSCPLDEALVQCTILYPLTTNDGAAGMDVFDLAPYGIFPKSGRSRIGEWETATVEPFFESLVKAMGARVTLKKLRGHNGHHVVESAFKAFSRALRNLIDQLSGKSENIMWGLNSESASESLNQKREASLARSTKETSISVHMNLNGEGNADIKTGIDTMDSLLTEMVKESGISLKVDCKGDLWVDDHHTSEDVAIAIGQVLNKALGTKGGLNRMWSASAEDGSAVVEVVMDLSNRPCLTHNLDLSLHDEEKVGGISIEMIEHIFDSLVMNAQMTVHIVQLKVGKAGELSTAAIRAFGKALARCIAVDPRRAGATASSKGTLSV